MSRQARIPAQVHQHTPCERYSRLPQVGSRGDATGAPLARYALRCGWCVRALGVTRAQMSMPSMPADPWPRVAANLTFYMYTDPSLDHGWMRNCKGFDALLRGVRFQNLAEVSLRSVMHAHPRRVDDPAKADLFYLPLYPYVSGALKNCSLPPGAPSAPPFKLLSSHEARMAVAKATLEVSPYFRRRLGRDHLWATTTWSTLSTSFAKRMRPLGFALYCTIVGRYKPFCRELCERKHTRLSSLGACVIHIPYVANPMATRAYRPGRQRTVLLSFAGSFDVCCSGAQIRCKLGDLMEATVSSLDVQIRPSLPAMSSNRSAAQMGPCTARAVAAVSKARDAAPQTPAGRQLGASALRESVVTEDAIEADGQLMSRSVFCLAPAGDNCVSGRFYSAIAAGCIPVVICGSSVEKHPVAYERSLPYGKFWIQVSKAEWIRSPVAVLARLRRMPKSEVEAYQAAIARHRADVLYDVPESRVGSNLLGAIAHRCLSPDALAKFNAGKVHGCSSNSTYFSSLDRSQGREPA